MSDAFEFKVLAPVCPPSPLGQVTQGGYYPKLVPMPVMRDLGAYALVYFLEGPCFYEDTTGQRARIQAGDLLLLFPGRGHRYGAVEANRWSHLSLVFQGPLFDLWRQADLISPERPIHHLRPLEYWRERLAAIVDGLAEVGIYQSVELLCRVQHFLLDALRQSAGSAEPDRDEQWLAKARASLSRADRLSGDIVASSAAGMGMSYDAFRRRFTRLAGISPGRYCARHVMDLACRLLKEPEARIADTAERLGFCDEFHFSKRFKQIMGMSPRDFHHQASERTRAKGRG
ncbi:MAG TPA: AraC family transcriptional regulator [Tepidisphaeraceae bacterium]|jgi:AraC-like DNA-binding protein